VGSIYYAPAMNIVSEVNRFNTFNSMCAMAGAPATISHNNGRKTRVSRTVSEGKKKLMTPRMITTIMLVLSVISELTTSNESMGLDKLLKIYDNLIKEDRKA